MVAKWRYDAFVELPMGKQTTQVLLAECLWVRSLDAPLKDLMVDEIMCEW